MSNYEFMLIANPKISEEDRNNSLNELKALFDKNGVKIEKEDVWGVKKLAYKINKCEEWFYILYNLELDGKLIKTMTKTINLDKNIWRHMFVKQGS